MIIHSLNTRHPMPTRLGPYGSLGKLPEEILGITIGMVLEPSPTHEPLPEDWFEYGGTRWEITFELLSTRCPRGIWLGLLLSSRMMALKAFGILQSRQWRSSLYEATWSFNSTTQILRLVDELELRDPFKGSLHRLFPEAPKISLQSIEYVVKCCDWNPGLQLNQVSCMLEVTLGLPCTIAAYWGPDFHWIHFARKWDLHLPLLKKVSLIVDLTEIPGNRIPLLRDKLGALQALIEMAKSKRGDIDIEAWIVVME